MSIGAIWAGRPLAIDRAWLESAMASALPDSPMLAEHEPAVTTNGIARIQVHGPLEARESLFGALFGATSYDSIRAELAKALADTDVQSIILDIDSPGGDIVGCQDTARAIRDAARIKQVNADVSGQCCSAAYWLASAADTITASETSTLGSIGVIATVGTQTSRDGFVVERYVSSQSPAKSPATDAGREALQQQVDDLAAVFVRDVATNRNVSEETVISSYGRGGSMVAERAHRAGMIDAVHSGRRHQQSTTSGETAGHVATEPAAGRREKGMDTEHLRAQLAETTAKLEAAERRADEAEAAQAAIAAAAEASRLEMEQRVAGLERAAQDQRRDSAIDAAYNRGAINAGAREQWAAWYDAAPDIVGQQLEALPSGSAVPTGVAGRGADVEDFVAETPATLDGKIRAVMAADGIDYRTASTKLWQEDPSAFDEAMAAREVAR